MKHTQDELIAVSHHLFYEFLMFKDIAAEIQTEKNEKKDIIKLEQR